MAYMSQEKKRKIAQKLKLALKGSGLKYSLAVRNHSTLVMTIISGPVDFFGELLVPAGVDEWKIESVKEMKSNGKSMNLNHYHYRKQFVPNGDVINLLDKIIPILNDGNWDRSDIMTDYFDVGWYLDIKVGRWNKPYVLTK